MAEELLLHASKQDFVALIEKIDGKINELNSIASDYAVLKNDVNEFIDGSDTNFDQMQQNVETNLEACRKEVALLTRARENLQRTVDQMESFGSDVGNLMKESAEAAGNIIKTTLTIEGLGL